MTADRFRRHPAARILGSDGQEAGAPPPHAARITAPVIADRPAADALAAALTAAEAGIGFRIGGGAGVPQWGAVPMFETLTSGSTGTPRRIRRSHRSWIASFAVNAQMFGIGAGDRVGILGRLSQSLALYGALEGAHLGAEVHLLDGLRPDRQTRAIAARGLTVVWATPAQLRQIPDAAGAAPTVRLVLVGGSKLDAATRAGARSVFPNADLREFYGAAETSFITLTDAATPPGSVGRPYPGVEIDIRDTAGRSATEGLIRVRSRYLFAGYGGDDPGGALWQDGWLSVGEAGRWDGAHLIVLGRAGRMVTIADQNVFPEEIEGFLASLPGVTQAAVIPRPDGLRGHVLHAVIAGGADDAAVLAACRAVLGPLKTPRKVLRVAAWPLLPSGKTDLAALAAMV